MSYLASFRDPKLAQALLQEIKREARFPVRVMEFCGGHTHAIFRFGLRQLLQGYVHLSSGPGCPVCVTSAHELDLAIAAAHIPGVIITSFGDMLRVPGSRGDLQLARQQGADVRIVYSPADAVALAKANPDREVIFLGVGFETTAPGVAAALLQAEQEQVPNFSVISMHKLTPPGIRAVLERGEVALHGILGPGHVSTIIGSQAWDFLPREYSVPVAIAGFEALDILAALAALVRAVMRQQPEVFNTYLRSVRPEGNPVAQHVMLQIFEVADAEWRGFGLIPQSGLSLRPEWRHRDALHRFVLEVPPARENPGCRCGDVLRGVIEPLDCPLYGKACTPRRPIGPCMVSAEGACAAYYLYGVDVA